MKILLALALSLAAAGAAWAQTKAPCPKGLPADATCYQGRDANGAEYVVATPARWNGALVLHAHGGPRLKPPAPGYGNADLARFAVIVKEGYVFAASSYRRGGYGVSMAAEDTDNLRKLYIERFGKPQLVFAHGQSWGGNVAAKLIELYGKAPDGTNNYDGALLTSGVLGGGTHSYNFRLDLRVVYQYYCRNHPRADEPQYPLWMGLPAEAKMTRKELEARVDECTGIRHPAAERSEAQRRNLANILAVIRVPERTLVAHLAWSTFLFRDLVQKRLDGRDPFDNEGVRYAGSDDDAALNAGVLRYRADPQAVAALAKDADLTGEIPVPVLTLHAIDDPTAFVEFESDYRQRVERAGRGVLLVQTFSDEHEHSKLSDAEYATLLAALRAWVRKGVTPTAQSVADACPAFARKTGEPCLFRPEYHPAPLSAREYPRTE
jgi:hypothetical protein